jgi:hypothetical protein
MYSNAAPERVVSSLKLFESLQRRAVLELHGARTTAAPALHKPAGLERPTVTFTIHDAGDTRQAIVR